MERISGTILREITLEEATYLNALMDRDEPRKARSNGTCPVCGSYIGKYHVFCEKCGQRIDQENTDF